LLIVDEAEVVRDMLGEILAESPYELHYAEDGTEALEIYRQGKIDVVLTDIWMEPMNGLDLLKALNRHDPHSVVVMMTGFDRKDFIMEAFRNQAFAYLEKPFEVDELYDTLERAFRAREEKMMVAKILKGEQPDAPHPANERPADPRYEKASAAMVEAEMEALQDSLIELQDELKRKTESIDKLKAELEATRGAGAGGSTASAAELAERAAKLKEREEMIEELEGMLKEREAYVQEVENQLADRGQQLQELEAHLEQKSEDIESLKKGDA
jgi:CheY-like chemotaxis protein